MKFFRTIRGRAILFLFPTYLLTAVIITLYSYHNSVSHFTQLGLANLTDTVEMARIVCEENHLLVKEGKLTLEQAKERVRVVLNGPLKDGKRDLSGVRFKFGNEDYLFAIDSRGFTQMHPKVPLEKDFSKFEFIRDFMGKKNGVVEYRWSNPGETVKREKIAIIRYFEPWDWIIGIGAYRDHFTQPARDQLRISLLLLALFSVLFFAVLLVIAFSVTNPLNRLRESVARYQEEDPKPIEGISSKDEVGELVRAYNVMISGIRERNFIKDTFGRYVSTQVQEAILEKKVPLSGELKKVTVVFIDIRDFTSLSEQLPPEDLVTFLNDYFTRMVDAIISEEGTIDKFIGDAIMALFGAPISHEDDTRRALRAAHAILFELQKFNATRIQQGKDEIRIGIGIHTGEVIAGNIGSRKRMEYTVVGDTVNLAARLESLTSRYHTPILYSSDTYLDLKEVNHVKAREVDCVRVKGRTKSVTLYEDYGWRNSEEISLIDSTISDFQAGVHGFKRKEWQSAHSHFQNVLEKNPADGFARQYLLRCKRFLESPPPEDWDGVYVLTRK